MRPDPRLGRWTIAAITDVGRVRTHNEDTAVTWTAPAREGTEVPVLLIVADGMGGANAGDVASQLAVQTFLECVDHGIGENPLDALSTALEAANRAVRARAKLDVRLEGMGTTFTAAYVAGDTVWLSHVGDSRAYLIRDGGARRVTKDHSLVQELVREGKLSEEEARHDSRRNVLSRSLGTEDVLRFDSERFAEPLRVGDVLLLCSDGLHGPVEDHEIAAAVQDHELEVACALLVELANERGGHDNCSIVALRVEATAIDSIADPRTTGAGTARPADEDRTAAPRAARGGGSRSRTLWSILLLAVGAAGLLFATIVRKPTREGSMVLALDPGRAEEVSPSPSVEPAPDKGGVPATRSVKAPAPLDTKSTRDVHPANKESAAREAAGLLSLTITPPADYRYSLDGQALTAQGPQATITVAGGTHTIEVRHPEFGEQKFEVNLLGGEERELTYDFAQSLARGAIDIGLVGVKDATLYLDGKRYPKPAPCRIEGLVYGDHLIELEKDGYSVTGGPRRFRVSPADTLSVVLTLTRENKGKRP